LCWASSRAQTESVMKIFPTKQFIGTREPAGTAGFGYFRHFIICFFLSLPAWAQDNVETVQEIVRTDQNIVNTDQGDIETDQDVVEADQDDVESVQDDVEAVQDDVEAVQDDVEAVQDDVETVQDDVEADQDDIETVQGGVEPVQDDIETVQDDVEAVQAEVETVQTDVEAVQDAPNRAGDYLAAIERAEAANGAYSTELAELYQGLGHALAEQEKFDEAKTAFQRGLQIERINFGLNSPGQEQYLFAIADIEVRADDWNATESILQNIYWINADRFGERTPGMVAGLTEMIRWYVATYRLRSPVNAYMNLLRAEELAQQTEGIIEHQFGLGHPNTTNVLRQVSRLHFFMLNLLAQYGELINLELMSESNAIPDSFRSSRLPVTEDLLRKGASNYSKIIDSIDKQDGTTLLERVEAITRLGDWNLILGQRQTAGKLYQRAYELIAGSENPEPAVAEYFAAPRLVRFTELEENPASEVTTEAESKTVQVSMTIQSSGRPYDIKVLDPPEEMSKDLISQTEKNVRRLPFRPRLDNGIPVQTEGFILNYPIEDSQAKS